MPNIITLSFISWYYIISCITLTVINAITLSVTVLLH